MSEGPRKAPKGLSPEAKRWWNDLTDQFEITDAGAYLLLTLAMESFDDMRQAQEVLKREGPTIKNSRGALTQNPAAMVVRDSRNLLLRSLKALNLDVGPDPLESGR